MKTHSTNYENTFIEVADDCPVKMAEIPPVKDDAKTAANIQFEMVSKNRYKFTSDDVLFHVFAEKHNVSKKDLNAARTKFFSKGQPCFRASPLPKRYGWGIHSDSSGKIALYPIESKEYKKLSADKKLKRLKAMKASR